MKKLEVFHSYWGYDGFLPFHEKAIDSILDDHNTTAHRGREIYLALLKEGMAVIISPLISLIKDQVDSLNDFDISALSDR